MRTAMALRRDDVWTRRVTRMVGLSTAVHLALFAAIALLGAWLATRRPPPIVAYSVELTDLPGTGGRLPGGPGNNLIGRSPAPPAAPNAPPAPSVAPPLPTPAAPPAPVAAPPPPPPPPPAAAKPVPQPPPPPAAKPAEVEPKPVAKVEPKKIEPKPTEPKKVEPKPEAKPVEAAKKVEPKKVEAQPPPKPAEPPQAVAKTEPPPVAKTPPPAATPAPDAKPAAGANVAAKTAAPSDDYANAAQRFRNRMAAAGTGAGVPGQGVAGGGPGGGVLGTGGDGQGGGRVKSLEWVAYRQRIITEVKERWSNAIKRPGLLTTVRFRIARDGTISAVTVSKASGNTVYDQTAVAAVERVKQLPPPPPAYADEFAEFEINFYGDEEGGVS